MPTDPGPVVPGTVWPPTLARHPDYVTPARTATLLALLAEYTQTGRATVRAVAARRGLHFGTVHSHLVRLQEQGDLVANDADRFGTLRPLVGIVPFAGQVDQSGAAGPPA
ncbi:MAG TPA: helix-turn-helix domain-containing protein [Iamia sp.]|nr:helix-turn-helix domain-containing protein [Iamia sp.]